MVAHPNDESEVYNFIRERIDSVPHLEALLLLWNSRPQPWSLDNLATRLYVPTERVQTLLNDLIREQLVAIAPGQPDGYEYTSKSIEQDQLVAAVDATYRREVVRVATLIHSRPPSSVRDFARAFRFKKDKD
jgi:DNA-binding IscR family transcriptional regulator